MTRFQITLVDGPVTSDGAERHRTLLSAKTSAVRTASAILIETGGAFKGRAVSCEVRNDHTGSVSRFDVAILITPRPG